MFQANRRLFRQWLACVAVFAALTSSATAEPLWRRLVPKPRVDADPSESYTLTETNGPWLIMAATFSGDGAEDQARELILELRSRYNFPAFLHEMTFDLAAEAPMRGRDRFGRPRRAKFQRGDHVTEFAVLAGEFPSVDDIEAQNMLSTIKTIKPKALSGEQLERTTQNLAGLRLAQELAARGDDESDAPLSGPMSHAFITRNPVLPKDYFVPKGVDKFVAEMNAGVDHSLLDCPGTHTVKVATFRGRTILQSATLSGTSGAAKRAKEDPLVEAAENAHLLTVALRSKGWEAFEFHDRHESIVTIGSFDEVATGSANGKAIPAPAVQRIIQTFGAAYKTELSNHLDPSVERRTEEVKQRFNAAFTNSGQIASGLNPKFCVGIPFDIHPHVINVPRRSISSAYVRN